MRAVIISIHHQGSGNKSTVGTCSHWKKRLQKRTCCKVVFFHCLCRRRRHVWKSIVTPGKKMTGSQNVVKAFPNRKGLNIHQIYKNLITSSGITTITLVLPSCQITAYERILPAPPVPPAHTNWNGMHLGRSLQSLQPMYITDTIIFS